MKKKRKSPQIRPQAIVKTNATPGNLKFDMYLLLTCIIILIIAVLRAGLVNVPLERDEGEYAYMGKLILDGVPPYSTAYNMKLPGTYGMYSFLMLIFGTNTSGIHIGLLLMNAATMFLLFAGIKKIFNSAAGFYTAAVYGIMSLSPAFLGFAAHATHFVSFFVALALFFFAKYFASYNKVQCFLTGLFFGFAFLMKQQAVFFILFGGLSILIPWVFSKQKNYKNAIIHGLIYSAGVFIPYLLTVLLLLVGGAFDKFWFWTVEYASKYASGVDLKSGMQLFSMSFKPMWNEFLVFWILFFAGLISVFFVPLNAKQKSIALLFCIASFLSICPGFYFRQHYFIALLPAVGLMGYFSIWLIQTWILKYIKLNVGLLLLLIIVFASAITAFSKNKNYYFKPDPNLVSRTIYGTNPFIESPEIANYIKSNSTEKDKIAILGSEPQMYFYSDRQSATGYIYTYGLMEIHDYNKRMQEEMIAEIEKNKPKFLIFCNVPTSWLARPGSPQLIFEWFNKYVQQQGYVLTGVADIISMDQTVYKWGSDALNYQKKGKEYLMIFKKPS